MEIQVDIVIIGAGAVGAALAREFSRYTCSIAVVEKEADVAGGTSGRNSAVVHAGFNSRPGSLMARLCVEGSREFEGICRELDVPYRKTGKLVVARDESDIPGLEKLLEAGRKNGVAGLELIGKEELAGLEPHVRGIRAMLSGETAITNPFLYTVGLAENAADNGAVFFFNHEVTSISSTPGAGARFLTKAGGDLFRSRFLINSAGLSAGRISELAGDGGCRIYPCRGEYHILDTITSRFLSMPVYPVPRPGDGGLGVHLTPTTDGNILIGPSAEYIDTPEDYATTASVMRRLFLEARDLLPLLSTSQIIRSYSGIRAKLTPPETGGYADFVIRESDGVPGLVNLFGIESPGLTASIPIAKMVTGIVRDSFPLRPKENFHPDRRGIPRFRELTVEEQRSLCMEDPAWADAVCTCERVTKKEILLAAANPLGVKTLAGIKYRTHALAGRCQGSSCLQKIMRILVSDCGIPPGEITERGPGSEIVKGKIR